MRDEIAESADGPWKRLTEVYVELLDEDETSGDADSGVEEEFWEEQSTSRQGSAKNKPSSASDAKKQRQPAGLFGGQVKPWQLVAGGVTAAGLAAVALVAGLFRRSAISRPTPMRLPPIQTTRALRDAPRPKNVPPRGWQHPSRQRPTPPPRHPARRRPLPPVPTGPLPRHQFQRRLQRPRTTSSRPIRSRSDRSGQRFRPTSTMWPRSRRH